MTMVLPEPFIDIPRPRGEFPASKLILAGVVRDSGQLSATQKRDLDLMVFNGCVSKRGGVYRVRNRG